MATALAEDLTVHVFPKNMREEVRFELKEFKGKIRGDVRVWWADADDVDHPSGKGVSVPVEDLPKMLAGMTALVEAAKEMGLLS